MMRPLMATAVRINFMLFIDLFANMCAAFMDPNTDPKTLCPWCDEKLPSEPTPHLLNLIATARKSSYSDPRITNPLGLCGPPKMFITVCQRHRFESHHIPKAQRKGWPMRIEWNKLSKRVKSLSKRLKAIVDDVDEDFAPSSSRRAKSIECLESPDSRPRVGSVFWKDITKDVKKQGSRQTAGVKGQFDNFSRTQPG